MAVHHCPQNCGLRLYTDSQANIAILAKGASRNVKINALADDFWRTCRRRAITPVLHYVKTDENPADLPSRKKAKTRIDHRKIKDCFLS